MASPKRAKSKINRRKTIRIGGMAP